jgi:hypothetical protein
MQKEGTMTDVTPEQDGADESWEQAAPAVEIYPERSDNPHNHRYTLSLAPDKAPFLVVRAQDRAELRAILDDLAAENVYGLIGEAAALMKASAAIGAGLGPSTVMQAPQAPAQGFPAATPPPFGPNVSVPQAPGFQGPPQGGFGAPQGGFGQQAGGFGGGGGNGQGNRAQPKPRPAWPVVYKVSLNGGNRDAFKALREQNKDACKGKVAWAGGGDYWLHGDVAQGFAQFNPVPA